jgi:hypothetical protein
MRRRPLVLLFAFLAAGALAASGALWAALASWVPQDGKAMLIREAERRYPILVSVRSMRYEPLRGFVLMDVDVRARDSGETWVKLPTLQLRVRWLPLLLTRTVAFRGRALLEAPCRTMSLLSGRYRLKDRSLILDAQTDELPVASASGLLKRRLPAALADGAVRLQLHLKQAAGELPTVTGRIIGTGLLWRGDPWQAQGNLTLNGTAAPPETPGGRWSLRAIATLRGASLQGLPIADTISQMEGRARITEDRIDIEELSGTLLHSTWKAEGALRLSDAPGRPLSFEALVTSRAHLAPVTAAIPTLAARWQPEGAAEVRAACRGSWGAPSLIDCLTRAEFEGVALSGPLLTEPLTALAGAVSYDVLTRRLSIERLRGELRGEPFSVTGQLHGRPPHELSLRLTGILPLETARRWLREPSRVSELAGAADVDVTVDGTWSAPRLAGSAQLSDVTARWVEPALTAEHLSGSLLLSPELNRIPEATMRLNGQPLTLNAQWTPGPSPRLQAAVRFPQGRLWVTGGFDEEAVEIEAGRLALSRSEILLEGTISRREEGVSAVELSGAVELSDLATLPLVTLPSLAPWKLEGPVDVDARFEGRLANWASASIRGRLAAEDIRVRDLPLEQLTCLIEQRDRVLRVRIPAGRLADGRLVGELAVEHGAGATQYLLQLDLTGLQLANLTHVIPAWRDRSVVGMASARLLASGTWQDRRSWRGEGWIHGAGERLGDVPLLDRVFRGLFGMLGERMGLESLRRAQITQASVQWRLAQERFATDHLRLGGLAGAEPIAIYARGSVGFDQTLDFVIEPELSEGVVLQAPTTASLAGTVLKAAGQLERLRRLIGRHRLTGTLKEPVYRFEFGTQDVFRQLAPAPTDLLQNIFDAVR